MNQGRIIVITGSPGTGKTTTASIVAKESDMDKSVHMHTDDFFHYLSKGAIPPHLPESNKQNLVVIEAFLEAAKRYARGGYDVIVDGIVGPWFLEPWKALAQEDYEVHYIVLRASKKETMKRAVERSKLDRKTNIELVETMWEQFSGLGVYESNVIDTTTFTIKDTVSAIKERVASSADTTTFESNTFGSNLAFVQDRLSAERYFSRGNHYEEYRDYWENGNYTFSRNENPELVYVRARDIEGVYLSDRELGNPEGFWTRNGREGWSRENILRRASHIQDVRQNTESGMSLDELSQNPVLDDTIRSYYNNPVQVAQVGSYYVFQSDGRHRTLAAQSLDATGQRS